MLVKKSVASFAWDFATSMHSVGTDNFGECSCRIVRPNSKHPDAVQRGCCMMACFRSSLYMVMELLMRNPIWMVSSD
jgi:hypothetical protein